MARKRNSGNGNMNAGNAGQRMAAVASAAASAAVAQMAQRAPAMAAPRTDKQRARRRRQRQRRRARARENVGNLNWGPALAMGQAVPNENFEPMVPAVVDGHIAPEISALGTTTSGGAWALKALHPNGGIVTSAAGIPDHTHVPVVTPELRINHILTGGGGDSNDDIDIIFPGLPDVAVLWRRYKAGKAPTDIWNAEYWPTSQSTVFLSKEFAPDANDRDPIKIRATYACGNIGVDAPRARGMYAGLTIVHDAPALKDQGRIVAAQLPLVGDPEESVFELMADSATGTPPLRFHLVKSRACNLGFIPLTEDTLFQASPGAHVGEARNGCYLPLRFNEPVHIFETLQPGRTGVPAMLTFDRVDDPDTNTISFRNAAQNLNFATEGRLNFLAGVVLIRGVDSSSNFSLKARLGLEMQVERGGSSLAPFQHQSPPLDRFAIDQVTRFAQETEQAFPACYNDDNDMMNYIRTFLGIVKTGAGLLGKVGVPYVGALEPILGGLGFAPNRTAGHKAMAVRNSMQPMSRVARSRLLRAM